MLNSRFGDTVASLRIITGPGSGIEFPLEQPKLVFGRHSSCDCVLDHATVSRTHFCIERSGDKFLLIDLDSGNGTTVNDARVSWIGLRDGDRIQAGPFILVANLGADMKEREPPQPGEGEEQPFDPAHRHLYPIQYLEGIAHFNARRYFEAHEVWEEIWLQSRGERKLFYQMLIQAAVGLHHYERGNARGGRGMFKAVADKLDRLPAVFMSLDLIDFSRVFKEFFRELMEKEDDAAMYPPDRLRPQILLIPGEPYS